MASIIVRNVNKCITYASYSFVCGIPFRPRNNADEKPAAAMGVVKAKAGAKPKTKAAASAKGKKKAHSSDNDGKEQGEVARKDARTMGRRGRRGAQWCVGAAARLARVAGCGVGCSGTGRWYWWWEAWSDGDMRWKHQGGRTCLAARTSRGARSLARSQLLRLPYSYPPRTSPWFAAVLYSPVCGLRGPYTLMPVCS